MLASASTSRREILEKAGLDFIVDPAHVDEAFFKKNNPGLSPRQLAEELSVLKAQAVTKRHPELIVIGADQTLECDGQSFDKPPTMDVAKENLISLRGKTHTLNSAVCLARDGEILWSLVDTAHMTMRDFGDTFLEEYLDKSEETVLTSVGCYRLEGLGIHLFSRIEGDFFTILGLPLLQVLSFLRDNKILH